MSSAVAKVIIRSQLLTSFKSIREPSFVTFNRALSTSSWRANEKVKNDSSNLDPESDSRGEFI